MPQVASPADPAAGIDPGSEITEPEFLRFRDFFYRKTGIYFDTKKRYFVDKRLVQRIEATGHTSFRGYFNHLRFQASGKEIQELVNLMTVNETYFFREEYQFDCLIQSMLAEVVSTKRPGDPVRIWSVPCSTGEEPYSIGLQLLERWPGLNTWDVELHASDIDSHVLQRARDGIYGQRALDNLSPTVLRKYFTPLPGNLHRISQDLRQSVEFSLVNLADPAQMRRFRGFDVIFCRNVLIYFDDDSRREATESLFDALTPGGFLFLGHSESMSRMSSLFTIRKFPEAIAYQRPAAMEPRS